MGYLSQFIPSVGKTGLKSRKCVFDRSKACIPIFATTGFYNSRNTLVYVMSLKFVFPPNHVSLPRRWSKRAAFGSWERRDRLLRGYGSPEERVREWVRRFRRTVTFLRKC